MNWGYSAINYATSVSYSPDGTLVAVAGGEGVQLYDATKNVRVRGIGSTLGAWIGVSTFTPDSAAVLIGGAGVTNGVLSLWNVADGRLRTSFPTTANGIYSVAVSRDGGMILGGGQNANGGVLELWSAANSTLIESFATSATQVSSAAFTPDGKTVVTGGTTSGAGVVEVWDIGSGKLKASLNTAALNPTVTIAADGATVAVGGSGTTYGVLELWSLSSYSLVKSFPTALNAVNPKFSSDGKSLIISGNTFINGAPDGYYQGFLEYWDIANGTSTRTTLGPEINAIDFANGGAAAIAGWFRWERMFGVAYVVMYQPNYMPSLITGMGALGPGTLPIFSPDGTTVIGGGFGAYTGKTDVWSTSDGTWLASLSGPTSNVYTTGPIKYSPDGTMLAAVYNSGAAGDSVLQVLDASTRTLIKAIDLGPVTTWQLCFSPDGNQIAISGQDQTSAAILQIWSLKTGILLWNLPTLARQQVTSLTYSPDGSILVDCGVPGINIHSPSYGVAELWNTSTGSEIASPPTAASNLAPALFSPDGKTIVLAGAGANGGVLELWNLATYTRTTLNTTVSNPGSMRFSPDGKTLVVGGFNQKSNVYTGALELWNYPTGSLAATLALAPGTIGISSTFFSQDGQTLYVSTGGAASLQGFSLTDYRMLGFFSGGTIGLTVSNDGSKLAYVSGLSTLAISPIPTFKSYQIAGLSLSPTQIQGGLAVTGTLTLAKPAPPGGVPIEITWNPDNPNASGVYYVPAGSTSTNFTFDTQPVATQTTATVVASNGPYSASATLTLVPAPPPAPISVLIEPAAVVAGGFAIGIVTLDGPAGPNGLNVTLTSNNAAAKVQSPLTIFSGQTTGFFLVTTSGVNRSTSVTVIATANGKSASASFTIKPATLGQLALESRKVRGGSSTTGIVTLSGPAGPGGLVISLSSSSPLCSVPMTITIPFGKVQATFPVKTKAVSMPKTVTVTATGGPISKSATLTITPA